MLDDMNSLEIDFEPSLEVNVEQPISKDVWGITSWEDASSSSPLLSHTLTVMLLDKDTCL